MPQVSLHTLTDVNCKEIEELYNSTKDAEIWNYTPISQPESLDDFRHLFNDKCITYIVIDTQTGKVVGSISSERIDQTTFEFKLVFYSLDAQGKGYNSEANAILFKDMMSKGYKTALWKCNLYDEKSVTYLIMNRFLKKEFIYDDVEKDINKKKHHLLFSLKLKDWKARTII